MIRKVVKLLLVIAWMGLIFSFSNDTGVKSTKKSDGLIIKAAEVFLNRNLSDIEKDNLTKFLVVPVRKGAHLFVYSVLGILIFIFITEFISIGYKSLIYSFLISFLYACSDEIHQVFVSGRSGQVSDIFLDALGAGIGILLCLFIFRRRRKYE